MAAFDYPVHLTKSTPFAVNSGHLIFYDAIEPSLTSRSRVLSCIAEADGEAKLPDAVTVSGLKTWIAAAQESNKEFRSRNFLSMCSVLKVAPTRSMQVADAIDDENIDEWVQFAANRLLRHARCYSDASSTSQELRTMILNSLPLLTDDLQDRVFAVAAASPRRLRSLLDFLPTILHTAVLAATIKPDKFVRVYLSNRSIPSLAALASLPASPPSALSMEVFLDTHRHCETLWTLKPWEEVSHESVYTLQRALRHHSGLTSLHLAAVSINATVDELLLPALSTLTSLQSLSLEGRSRFAVGSASMLQKAFLALPQMHELTMSLVEAPDMTKRKLGAQEAFPSRCCLADMLSPATALTSLTIRIPHLKSVDRSCFTATAPLQLPHLSRLTVSFDSNHSLTASFISVVVAPITSLSLTDEFPKLRSRVSAAVAQQLLCALAAFTLLGSLSLVLPTKCAEGKILLGAMTDSPPAFFAAPHQLADVSVIAAPALIRRVVQLLATGPNMVTRLTLTCRHCSDPRHSDAWHGLIHALALLQLHALDLRCCPPLQQAKLTLDSLLPNTRTQLTALSISDWTCLGSNTDYQALSCMTNLQRLRLAHAARHGRLADACIASLRALHSLTSLDLKTSNVSQELVPGLVQNLPQQSLRALQELRVAVWPEYVSAEALVRYAIAFPALQRLVLAAQEAAMDEELVVFLGEIAASAGVALSVDVCAAPKRQ